MFARVSTLTGDRKRSDAVRDPVVGGLSGIETESVDFRLARTIRGPASTPIAPGRWRNACRRC